MKPLQSSRYFYQKCLKATYTVSDSGPCHYDLPPPTSLYARDTHTYTDLPVVTRQGHSVCDGLSQAKVTSFNANALFSPLLMSGCDS